MEWMSIIKSNAKIFVQANACTLFHNWELEDPLEAILVQPQTSHSYSILAPHFTIHSVSAQTLLGKGKSLLHIVVAAYYSIS